MLKKLKHWREMDIKCRKEVVDIHMSEKKTEQKFSAAFFEILSINHFVKISVTVSFFCQRHFNFRRLKVVKLFLAPLSYFKLNL